MDFTRLNQRHFSSLSDILRFQSYHIMLFLIRAAFPPSAYLHRTLNLSLTTNRGLCFWWTATNWSIILAHIAIIRGYVPRYVAIYGAVLRMKNYDRFASHSIISFSLIEWVVIRTITETIRYRNQMLQVVLELERSVDCEYTKVETNQLIHSFTRRLYYSTITLRAMIFGTLLQVVQLGVAFGEAYRVEGGIQVGEIVLYLYMAVSANLYGAYAMIFPCYFMTHLFFMVRLFKCRLVKAIQLLRVVRRGHGSIYSCPSLIARFHYEFLRLHRHLLMYNTGTRNHILMYDLIFKFCGSLSCSMMLQSGQTVAMSNSTYFILSMFATSYAALHSIYFALTFFPKQCSEAYGLVSGLATRPRISTGRTALRLNGLAEFTGGNNQFGFTYSSLYLIRTMNILENAATNGYFVVLFYKRMVG